MDFGKLNRVTGAIVFGLSLLGYFITVSPTLSYWDCGEFAACAYTLAIPHPPGSPLFLLVGRLFTMIPFSELGYALGLAVSDYDIAYRVNMISVLSSAFSVLFLYLTIVRLILQWKPRPTTTYESLKIQFAAALGALTFAFTYSQWFNAVEAEVYASSIFFTAIVVWAIMAWLEKPDDIHSDVYLLLIAYMVGLAIGVHLLNILALPFIFFIIYTKKFEITFTSLAAFAAIGLIAVGIIYKVFIFYSIQIPVFMDQFGLATASVLLLFGILIYFSYYFIRRNHHTGALLSLSSLLIFIGYSTYALIMIRSGLDPNVDQNNPDTWQSFVRYLNREQYGDFSMFPRVAPFWEYQFKKMFVRYFNWQFVGRPDEFSLSAIDQFFNAIGLTVNKYLHTEEDRYGYMYTVFSWRGLYGLPFLVGLLGAIHHFGRDWKRALATFGLFVMTGFAIIMYLNQPDPQPRERDYSYAGCFFAFSIWIGIGLYAIADAIEEYFKNKSFVPHLTYAMFGLAAVLLPLNMYVYNKPTSSRQDNLVAWDYSYNMLVSCEPDAILYTNGDNDTFPLWYLQEVEKVRPDVRIVNLSLLNTDWYINQIKNNELQYERDGEKITARKVAIGYSDKQILGDPKVPNSAIQPIAWKTRTFGIDVPKEQYWKDWVESGREKPAGWDTMAVPKMTFEVQPTIRSQYGEGLRVQDLMVLDILFANRFNRPIYFAITVSPDNTVGLSRYLRMDGLVSKLVSVPDIGLSNKHIHENLFKNYKFRNLNNPNVVYDDNIRRLTQNYRSLYLQLADYFRSRRHQQDGPALHTYFNDAYPAMNDDQRALSILDRMQTLLPDSIIPMRDYRLRLTVAQFYTDLGQPEKARAELDDIVANEPRYRPDPAMKYHLASAYMSLLKDNDRAIELLDPLVAADPTNFNATILYTQALESKGEYQRAIDLLDKWLLIDPNNGAVKAKLAELRTKVK
jgi:hypothetical protein